MAIRMGCWHVVFNSIFIMNIYTNYLKSTKNRPLRSHSGQGEWMQARVQTQGAVRACRESGVQISGEGAQTHRGGIDGGNSTDAGAGGADAPRSSHGRRRKGRAQ